MPSIEPVSTLRPSVAHTDLKTEQMRFGSVVSDSLEIAKGSPIDWKPERPSLTPPNELPKTMPWSDYRLLTVSDETRELGNQILDTLSTRLSGIKDHIREISAENIQKLKEAAERANSSAWWSTLKKIASCLLAALSIVIGAAFVASGGGALIGGAMIASGILSLANFALSESGTWDWVAKELSNGNEEWRKKLSWILPMSVGILAGGIGLAGAFSTGAIQLMEKAVYIAQTLVTLFDGATTLGKGQADARLIWTQADLEKIQALLTVQRSHFDSLLKEIESSLNDFKAVKAKAKKTVQIISQSNIQLVRA